MTNNEFRKTRDYTLNTQKQTKNKRNLDKKTCKNTRKIPHTVYSGF